MLVRQARWDLGEQIEPPAGEAFLIRRNRSPAELLDEHFVERVELEVREERVDFLFPGFVFHTEAVVPAGSAGGKDARG